ncbi:reverse transcriptase domain-containing protein [Tanacetum coccineum]
MFRESYNFAPVHPHDLRTMDEFYGPSIIGRGGPIAPTTVQQPVFVLKNHMIERICQNCQFHGFECEDANEHLNKYLSVTQFMKKNEVCEDIFSLNLFPFSLSHEVESWFYRLKTHSIHTWEEMVLKFLLKYYPYSKAMQLRKEILNFWQLPTESIFEAWERFKSYLRKCPDHRILLVDQILTFYHGITMIDREKIMWDAEVYYDTTTSVSSQYSETTSLLSAQIEVLGKQIAYISQNLQHQPRPGHPNTVYYAYSNESDEDEPSEAEKSEIYPLIRESTDTFLMGDEEIELNYHEDIDDLVPIPRAFEKPLDSLDLISETFDMTITNPLFDFDSEFTLNSDNSIFDIQNEESDEFETETVMEEVQIHSSQSTTQISPPYEKLTFDLTMPNPILTFS